ncbi:MAG: hypothetical protein HND58_16065 [Planctomycetota bacterium]|nr:MAG: hypothetical protein HND58_16065 [Planctomycetota bacterium]
MAKENLPDNDNRLGQIKEGAGLEDSKINQEFVDFIRKWSTPILLIAAAAALGYFLYNKRIEARQAHIDEAFAQYNQSANTFSPSPDALRRIAADFDDVKGVSIMARLSAADEYLRSVQRGIRPGSPLDPATGEPENEEDFLTPDGEDRVRLLDEAEALYREVWNETQKNPAMAIHTLSALYGLAAVSESRPDLDAAKNTLDQAMALAEERGFVEHVALTRQRIDNLPRLTRITLPKKADLPVPPEPEPLEIDETVGPLPVEGVTSEGVTEVIDEEGSESESSDADDAGAGDSGTEDSGTDDTTTDDAAGDDASDDGR